MYNVPHYFEGYCTELFKIYDIENAHFLVLE